jgi:acetamidase/formamidase
MTVHRFKPSHFHNTIGAHPSVLDVESGDTIITRTLDAHGFVDGGKQPGRNPNPMTGPFFVKGAEPGDTLSVMVKRITMTSASGWTRAGLAHPVIEPSDIPLLPPRDKLFWIIDNNSGTARPKNADGRFAAWSAAIDPMIGCLGVAPAGGQAISTATSGPYGGNMDYRLIKAGTDIRFPVSVPGALFFLGDCHAAQGDGEIAGTGIETAAEVEFELSVIKDKPVNGPRGETADDLFTIGNQRPLDEALQIATSEMLKLLMTDYRLTATEAGHVMAMAVRYDIANVFNPAYSVACRIPKAALSSLANPV